MPKGFKTVRRYNARLFASEYSATNHQMGQEVEDTWLELQNDLASMYNNSRHYIVNCGHYIQDEKPQVAIDAIKEMIKIVKK